MRNDILLSKVEMNCPVCGKYHAVEKHRRRTQALVKGIEVNYEELYFVCERAVSDENEFVPAELLDTNLLAARNSYRKTRGLLTSAEIAEVRTFYGLTQSEFAYLMGWGEVTVTRYESKTIQDETYDNLIKMAKENPLFALQNLEKHKSKFSNDAYMRIKRAILVRVDEYGLGYFKKQLIIGYYLRFSDENDLNGFKVLDLNKVADVIGYFADQINMLYRVKLMKLLWYADAIHFIRHGKSMMGLVYKHMPFGALPLGYDEIIYLPTVSVEEKIINDDIGYRIIPNGKVSLNRFSKNEIDILRLVSKTFKTMSTNEVVEYMHSEHAYMATEPYDLISYKLVKELNELK